MLGALTLILFCQLVGEVIAKLANLPIPGPVLGMVLLFCLLLVFKEKMPEEVDHTGGFLLRYLALLFVPAGVGVISNLELLAKSWAPITGVVLIGTCVTIAVSGSVMQFVNRHSKKPQGSEE